MSSMLRFLKTIPLIENNEFAITTLGYFSISKHSLFRVCPITFKCLQYCLVPLYTCTSSLPILWPWTNPFWKYDQDFFWLTLTFSFWSFLFQLPCHLRRRSTVVLISRIFTPLVSLILYNWGNPMFNDDESYFTTACMDETSFTS